MIMNDEKCCGNCKHWTREWQDDNLSDLGQCTRYPPVVAYDFTLLYSVHDIKSVDKFPSISYVRICGEWCRDENA